MNKSSSTGNLGSLVDSLLGKNKNAEFPTKKNSTGRSRADDASKVKRTRSRSSTRLGGRGLPRRSNTLDSAAFEGSVISAMSNIKLGQLPKKSDQDHMADIFKTAGELEDLAKAARKARRRKTGVRRCKSNVSQVSTASGMSDHSGRSFKTTRSTSSFSRLMSPFTKSNDDEAKVPNTTGGRRRSRRGVSPFRGLSRKNSSKDLQANSEHSEVPQVPQKLECKRRSRASSRTRPQAMENPYKPSFYHDSDDEDDSLVLGENETLDDYSKQIKTEVQNMTIVINWGSPQPQAAT